jgi:type II secretion system protein G
MNNKGFTLIELLIVVAIIGILAAIAVPNFMNAQIRAKVARAQADQKALGTALESYRLDNNGYPLGGASYAVFGLDKLTSPNAYMSGIPTDPFEFKVESTAGGFGWFPETMPNYVYLYTKGGNEALSKDYYFNTGQIDSWVAGSAPRVVDKWQLRSVGPNGQGDYALAYDSSNGMLSPGDICRFGP